jgi:hypothetical protein
LVTGHTLPLMAASAMPSAVPQITAAAGIF